MGGALEKFVARGGKNLSGKKKKKKIWRPKVNKEGDLGQALPPFVKEELGKYKKQHGGGLRNRKKKKLSP